MSIWWDLVRRSNGETDSNAVNEEKSVVRPQPAEKKETREKIQVKFFETSGFGVELEHNVNDFLENLCQNGHSEVVDIRYNRCYDISVNRWSVMVIYKTKE